jgi:hypothetical protein
LVEELDEGLPSFVLGQWSRRASWSRCGHASGESNGRA